MSERVELRADPADIKRWREAAKAQRLTLSAWMRLVLHHASVKP